MDPNNTNAIEIAKSKKSDDVDKFVAFSDTIDGIYVDAKNILSNYGYPVGNLAEFLEVVGEVKRHLALAASYIVNPGAPDIADGIRERIKCGID